MFKQLFNSNHAAPPPSVIKDPFNKNQITSILIKFNGEYRQSYWYGVVEFRNGNTRGEQRTKDCSSYEELMIEMKAIYDSLDK